MFVELAADVVVVVEVEVEVEVEVDVVDVDPAAAVVEDEAAATGEDAADVATEVPFLFDANTLTRKLNPTSLVVGA